MHHFVRLLLLSWLILLSVAAQAQAPTISSFSPTSGPASTTVTVTGTNLTNIRSVVLRGIPCNITPISATQASFKVPAQASTGKFRLTTTSGNVLSGSDFTITRASSSLTYELRSSNFNGIDVGTFAMPAFTDLDHDGLIDMLVGQEIDGLVSHYEQSAANSTSFILRSTNLSGLTGHYNSIVSVTDIDGDGLLEMVVGSGAGNFKHYEQTAANSASFTQLSNDFNNIFSTGGTTYQSPHFTDVDGDGLLDLLVGDEFVSRWEQNAANSGTFSQLNVQTFGPTADAGNGGSEVCVIDLDGDNLLDMLVARANGQLFHYEQNSVNGTAFTQVATTFSGIAVSGYPGPAITDLDGDGLLDLILGGADGILRHYEQAGTPTITSFMPTSGPVGTSVTITGTNLAGATSVSVNGTAGTILGTPTATSLTFTVGVGSTTGAVSVVAPGGTATGSTFTVTQPPTITSFTPTSGLVGTSVTITGTNLTGATSARVNGTAGTIQGTPTATSLTFTVGAGSTTGAVSIVTPNGTATGSTFTVIQPPTITSFTPTSGPVGTSVTITGTNLTGATAARVNGTAGTIQGTPTATSVTFTVGVGSTTGAVSVTTPGGTATGSTFTVIPAPTITSFTPTSGPVGTSVTVTGTNLTGATAARVNGSAGTLVGTPTATSLTFTVGVGSTTGAVSVVTPGGTATGSTFTVVQVPTITSFTPTSGPVGTSVTITGTNLTGATSVTVNGTAGTLVGTPTATSLTFTVGAGSTTGAVSLTTPGGTATGSTFTIIPAPTITSFTPTSGPVGTSVTITGTNLTGATAVRVNGTAGTLVGTPTATSLTFTVGAGSNTGAVSVTTPGGTATGGTFTVTQEANLAITVSDSPDPVGEGSTLTYTVNVSNAGPNTASSLVVTFTLPAGAVFTSASGTGWVASFSSGTVTATRATLAVGAAPTITIQVGAPGEGGTITATATVSSAITDPNVANNSATVTTTVTGVNDAPVVTTSGGSTAWLQGGGPVAVDGAATVMDIDNATLTSATVSITTGLMASQDVLAFTNANGITGSYSAGTGTLTLSGAASVADYQAALRTVTYNNTAGSPTGTSRTIRFVVNDGSANSVAVTKTVTITTQTAAPVVNAPANGSSTNDTTPTYSGTAPGSSSVTIYVDGTSIGTQTAASGGSWSRTPATPLSEGVHTVYATAQSTGKPVSVASNTNTFTIDVTRPTVTISSLAGTSGSTTNTSPIPVTITFSEPVTGFGNTLIAVANGTKSGYTAVSATTYTVNVTPTGAAPVTVTINVAAGAANDAAGNTNTAATAFSLIYSPAGPTITSFTPTSGPVGTSVTITGTNLTGATAAAVNGTAGTLVGTPTATSLTFTVGAGSTTGAVSVTKAGNTVTGSTFTVTRPPTALALSPQSVAENAGANALVGTFSTTDPDVGNTFTYSLVSGIGSTDNALVDITGNQLRLIADPDFEVKSSYAIRVRTTDNTSLFVEQTFVVAVTNVNETPSLADQARTVDEAATIGTAVGAPVVATDPDNGTTLTYTITGGNPGGAFAINPTTGQITVAAGLDYETRANYNLLVEVSDGTLTDIGAVAITVTNVNEAPTALTLTNANINENVGSNFFVGALLTTDPDGVGTFTYTLVSGAGSTDNGLVTFTNGNQLRIIANPDYETQPSYAIRVRTTDAGGLSFVQTFVITINDVNEAPDLADQTRTVAETAAIGTNVGVPVTATDPDNGATLTYTLISGNIGGAFALDATTGQITVAGTLNAQTRANYNLLIRASDGTLTDDAIVVVTVTNINQAPTAITLLNSTINENAGANAFVGALLTTDPDAFDSFTYTLVSGPGSTDNALVNITNGNQLRITSSPDFETRASYAVRIRSTDGGGLFTEQAFILTINDVNEAPSLADQPRTVSEAATIGTAVGAPVVATDPDAGTSLTYTITGGNIGGAFAINPTTGQLTVAAGLDYETRANYNLLVEVSDGTLTDVAAVAITVTNVNEAPTALTLTNATVNENVGANFFVGAFLTTDPDGGSTYTYSLVVGPGSTDNALVTLTNGNQLRLIASPDYETQPSYVIRVRTTDPGGLWIEQTFTITVNDLAEGPGLSSFSPTLGPEGTVVTLIGADFSGTTAVRFNGIPAAGFTVVSATQLTATVPVGATTGVITVITGSGSGQTASAFEVLPIYSGTFNSCLSAPPITSTGSGQWQYLRAANGQLVAALNDQGHALGTVSIDFYLNQGGVRADAQGREYFDRNWKLTAQNTFTGQQVRVRFYARNAEFTAYQAANDADGNDVTSRSQLRLTQYSGPNEDCQLANNNWTTADTRLLTPAAVEALSGANWFALETVVADHFSEFFLNGGTDPLPVELVAFTARRPNAKAVTMAWNTASEQDNAGFIVERSATGHDFVAISELLAGHGTSTQPHAYTWTDGAAPAGVTYYRLRQVDLDGSPSYSTVVAVAPAGPVSVEPLLVWPNPATSLVKVSGAGSEPIELRDVTGRLLRTVVGPTDGAELDLRGLPTGMYLLRCGAQVQQLMVE